jgi:predicted metal-dependent phosphotriesterase family hydrolase
MEPQQPDMRPRQTTQTGDHPAQLVTVTGALDPAEAGVVDAHNHVWIAPVPGAAPGAPVLDDEPAIAAELRDYRQAGGRAIVDCQPGGCGRDGRALRRLAEASGVAIVASTGFHLRRYYPDDYWLFDASSQRAAAHFCAELTTGLAETAGSDRPVRAGLVKIAFEAMIERTPCDLVQAAVWACVETGAALEAHTERGQDAERILALLIGFGLGADRIVLCHVDKQPDAELHRALAQAGALLEYDTFYRPKYRPDERVWPLLKQMIADGLSENIAVATDMADPAMWSHMGGGPGLTGLTGQIIPRLEAEGVDAGTIRRLTGENIARHLARKPITTNHRKEHTHARSTIRL